MMGNHLAPTENPEHAPSSMEGQFTLSEDTKDATLGQQNDKYLATKWEIRAYYACVACFLVEGCDLSLRQLLHWKQRIVSVQ